MPAGFGPASCHRRSGPPGAPRPPRGQKSAAGAVQGVDDGQAHQEGRREDAGGGNGATHNGGGGRHAGDRGAESLLGNRPHAENRAQSLKKTHVWAIRGADVEYAAISKFADGAEREQGVRLQEVISRKRGQIAAAWQKAFGG